MFLYSVLAHIYKETSFFDATLPWERRFLMVVFRNENTFHVH